MLLSLAVIGEITVLAAIGLILVKILPVEIKRYKEKKNATVL